MKRSNDDGWVIELARDVVTWVIQRFESKEPQEFIVYDVPMADSGELIQHLVENKIKL